jgi:hypothetical protein
MFDVEIGTCRIKGVATEENTLGLHRLDVCGRPAIAGGVSEVRAVVCQNGVDSVRNGINQVTEEVGCNSTRRLPVQLDESELRGPVNGDQKIELALSGLHLGDVDMEEADRIRLELLLRDFLASDVRQASDAMALEAAMQRCSDDRVRFGMVACKA